MKTSTASVLLDCTPDTFWTIYLDEAYLRALYLDELQYRAFDLLEATGDSRRLRIMPKINLPGPIAKLVGDSFVYENSGTLDRARNVWTWRMQQPGAKKELVATRGSIRIEAVGTSQCRRSDEVVIEAKLFALGGLIESVAEKETKAAWAKELALLQRWVKERADRVDQRA